MFSVFSDYTREVFGRNQDSDDDDAGDSDNDGGLFAQCLAQRDLQIRAAVHTPSTSPSRSSTPPPSDLTGNDTSLSPPNAALDGHVPSGSDSGSVAAASGSGSGTA